MPIVRFIRCEITLQGFKALIIKIVPRIENLYKYTELIENPKICKDKLFKTSWMGSVSRLEITESEFNVSKKKDQENAS